VRQIGSLPSESQAQIFSDYLYSAGVANEVEEKADAAGHAKAWNIWVHSEEQLDLAKRLLKEYQADPETPRFREATTVARRKREQEEQELKAFRKRIFTRERILPRYDRIGPLTGTLIGISVAVTLVSGFGGDPTFIRYLLISQYVGAGLVEVSHGQVWRLITPIFVHLGILHILFNMLWLKDLGSMIERRQGAWTLAALVAAIAVASNVGQFLMSGPLFGGMSGVVYGLLGYAWIRGRYDFSSGLFVHPQTVVMMVVWFAVCLVGVMGNVANTAHGVGFAVGIAWGFVTAKIATRSIGRRKR
jgi:GlpG protein